MVQQQQQTRTKLTWEKYYMREQSTDHKILPRVNKINHYGLTMVNIFRRWQEPDVLDETDLARRI